MLQHVSGLLHRGLLRRTLCRRRWGRLLWNETAILPAMRIPRYSYRLPRFWHVLIAMFYKVLTQGLTQNGIYCTTNSLKHAILGYHGVPYFQTHPLDVFFWCVTWHQWPFQEPKLEVPTIYKAYVREYPQKICPYMVQHLHFRILKFPFTWCYLGICHARYNPRSITSSVALWRIYKKCWGSFLGATSPNLRSAGSRSYCFKMDEWLRIVEWVDHKFYPLKDCWVFQQCLTSRVKSTSMVVFPYFRQDWKWTMLHCGKEMILPGFPTGHRVILKFLGLLEVGYPKWYSWSLICHLVLCTDRIVIQPS